MNNDDYGKNVLTAIIIMILAIFGGGILMVIVIWLLSFI